MLVLVTSWQPWTLLVQPLNTFDGLTWIMALLAPPGPRMGPSFVGECHTTSQDPGLIRIRTTFCSHPARACVQHLATTSSKKKLAVTFSFSSEIELGLPAPNVTCINQDALLVSGYVSTQPLGMGYAFLIRAYSTSPAAQINCTQLLVAPGSPSNATLQVASTSDAWVAWVGDTEYDMDAGTPEKGYSFRGIDPVTKVLGLSPPQAFADYPALLNQHTRDIADTLTSPFSLDLGQAPDFDSPTNVLKAKYTIDGPKSNAYLDWLLFNYGRYLLVSSARGVLPANLQGKWADGLANAWGAGNLFL